MLKLTLTFLFLLPSGLCTEYYVNPESDTASSTCSLLGNECRNISFYAAQSDKYFKDDTIFYFLEGIHVMASDTLIEIADINNLTFVGIGQTETGDFDTITISTVRIKCSNNSGGFSFKNGSNISFQGISIIGCGSEIYLPSLYDIGSVAVSFDSVVSVNLEFLSVLNTSGIGVSLFNCFDIVIRESSFAMNQASESCINSEVPICFGGNVLIQYSDSEDNLLEFPDNMLTNITVTNSNFSFGYSTVQGVGGGLSVSYCSSYPLFVMYDNIVSYGNAGVQGANLDFHVFQSTNYTLIANNLNSLYGNAFHVFPSAVTDILQVNGAGFSFLETIYSGVEKSRNAHIRFTSCEMSHGVAYSYGGLALQWSIHDFQNTYISIQNCNFTNNTGREGVGIHAIAPRSLFTDKLSIELNNIRVSSNRDNMADSDRFNAGILLQNIHAIVENITIIDNELTGAIIVESILSIKGENYFVNNSGINGGGLAIYESSVLLLRPPVNIWFLQNSATGRGGAIYVRVLQFFDNVDCFYQFPFGISRNSDVALYFDGNSAHVAGDVLYGGGIFNCISTFSDFNNLFLFPNQTGPSVVSSNPLNVCFCDKDNMIDCSILTQSTSISPGQTFYTQVAIVGQYFGAVPGVLQIKDYTNEPPVTQLEDIHITGCNNVSYRIKLTDASQENSSLSFSLQREMEDLTVAPRKLEINITPCPPGFELDTITGTCTCIGELENIQSVVCDVTTEQMSRQGSVWMGYNDAGNCTIVREDCPYDYCLTSNVTFHITEPNPQCALNRAGVMCGGCNEGYSLMLGSNKCGECSNVSILLIVLFLLAGVAVVVLITALNMTFSVGLINGLIFYGNIVKIHEDVFFPKGPIPVLSQFISWINLDFGIEACFFNGMTSLSKAWLQFVFPVYLWILVLGIILLARCSKRMTKLFGTNSLPVLATLILLSYAKLFRAIVNASVGTIINCGQSSTRAWYVDPNIQYDDPAHLTLVIVAVIFLIGLCLPYTVILFINPLIIKCLASNRCVKLGFNKFRLRLRLFLDAYNAPFKSHWGVWTGLLLTVRFVSVLIVSVLSKTDEVISVGIMMAFILSLFAVAGGVYKTSYLNFLEAWFIFNLLFMVSLVTDNDTMTQTATGISTTVTLITFIGILVFHIWLKVEDTNFGKNLKTRFLKAFKVKDEVKEIENSVGYDEMINTVRSTSVNVGPSDVVRRRETLLYPLVEDSVERNIKTV